jgi:hypothetical protein
LFHILDEEMDPTEYESTELDVYFQSRRMHCMTTIYNDDDDDDASIDNEENEHAVVDKEDDDDDIIRTDLYFVSFS